AVGVMDVGGVVLVVVREAFRAALVWIGCGFHGDDRRLAQVVTFPFGGTAAECGQKQDGNKDGQRPIHGNCSNSGSERIPAKGFPGAMPIKCGCRPERFEGHFCRPTMDSSGGLDDGFPTRALNWSFCRGGGGRGALVLSGADLLMEDPTVGSC